MAGNMSVKIGLDVSAYNKGIKEATKETKQYTNQVTELTKDLPSLTREFKQTYNQAKNLTLAVSKLTEEQKNSAEGRAMVKMLEDTKEKAAALKDQMGDLAEEIKNKASDTRGLDALKEGIGVLGNSFSALAGTIGVVTGKEEIMKKAVVSFTTVQSTLNAVTAIQNALQKQSALMDGIRTIQLKAKTIATNINTGATEANTAATSAGTIAQAAFNTVANANPYVLLTTVILGLATAIGTYVIATDGATDAEEKQQAELKKTREEFEKSSRSAKAAGADAVATFKQLETQYKSLKTTLEKNKFLDENKNKFKSMGLEIDNVNELEDLFTKNTDAVCNALRKRAIAEAWGELYKEKMKNKLEKDANGSIANGRYYKNVKAGQSAADLTDEEAKALGIDKYINRTIATPYGPTTSILPKKLTAEEANKVNDYRKAQGLAQIAKEQAEVNKYEDAYTKALQEEADAWDNINKKFRTTNNQEKSSTSKEIKALKGSLADLQEQRNKLVENQTKGITKYSSDEYNKMLKDLDDKIHLKELEIGVKLAENADKKFIEDVNKLFDKYNQSKNKSNKLTFDFDGLGEKGKAIEEEYNRLYDLQQGLMDMLSNPELDFTQYEALYNWLQQIAAQIGVVTTKAQEMSDAAIRNKMAEDMAKEADENRIKAINGLTSAASSMGKGLQDLGKLSDDKTLNVAGTIAQALATLSLSFAQSMKSSWTVWDWIAGGVAGAATLASLAAQIKEINKTSGYAGGGVIEGPYQTGDRLLARVNAGEMILNRRQQNNLFNAIDNNRLYDRGEAVVVQGVTTVRGTDLDIVWRNYSNYKNKTR